MGVNFMKKTKTHSKNNFSKISKSKGMTFIEVLVALVIIVVGILGAVALQATAKKGSFDAMQRSLASSLAQDIIERMRNNDATALVSYNKVDYGVALDAVPSKRCNTEGTLCTPDEMVTNDQYEFELALMGADVTNDGNNVGGLVGAVGCITTAINVVTVIITWEGRTEISDGGAVGKCGIESNKRRQVMMEAFIY